MRQQLIECTGLRVCESALPQNKTADAPRLW